MNKIIKPYLPYLTLVFLVILVMSVSISAIGCQNIPDAGKRYDDELTLATNTKKA